MRYAWESCDALLRDTTSIAGLRKPEGDPHARWDVAVFDGAYPECLLAILHGESVPTIMLNTVINHLPWQLLDFRPSCLRESIIYLCLSSREFNLTWHLESRLIRYFRWISLDADYRYWVVASKVKLRNYQGFKRNELSHGKCQVRKENVILRMIYND